MKKTKTILLCVLVIVSTFITSAGFINAENDNILYESEFENISNTLNQLSVEIIKPEKALYLNDNKVFPLIFGTLILGPITVEADVAGSTAEKVEFYIDNVIKYTDYSEPFSWKWDEQISMKHTIKIKAYDQTLTSVEKTDSVWIFNGGTDITPPEVWITDPLPTDLLYEPTWDIAVVSEDDVSLSAAQIGGSEEVAHTVFEYSTDGNEWTQIGVDTNGGFEGIVFDSGEDPWYGGNKKMGEEGWNSRWDITDFPEGDYFLRATMTDITGRSGSCTKKIHLDRTPPRPIIQSPPFGAKVSGTVQFEASSIASDVVSMQVKLFHGSPGWFNQSGTGGARQNPGDGGICAPTSAANALAGLGDNRVYPPGQEGNDSALEKELEKKMGTDKKNGTNCWKPTGGPNNENETDQMGDAIKAYLEERGIGCSNDAGYDVKVYKVKINNTNGVMGIVHGSNEINFDEYSKQIRLKQRVILAWADFKINSSATFKGWRIEFPKGTKSHAVTGRGTNSEKDGQEWNEGSIMDTNGQNKTIKWTNMSDGGGGNVSVISEGAGGNWKVLIGMWVICPKNKDAKTSNIGIDNTPQDGFAVAYDTTGVEDGTHVFIVDMTDSNGFIGSDSIVLEIDNTLEDEEPPNIQITAPIDGSFVTSPIDVTGQASDYDSGVVELDYQLEWEGGSYDGDSLYFDPPESYTGFELGPLYLEQFLDPEDEWVKITIYAIDGADNTGSDSITVYIEPDGEDTIPPVTTKEIGQPNEESGYIIWPFTPIWLNAIDEGGSGVNYIYYEIAWDTNEDGIWDETFTEQVFAPNVEIQLQMYGILHGLIELRWYAVDNADNVEGMHYQQHLVATW